MASQALLRPSQALLLIKAKKQIRRAKEDEKKLSDTKNQCCGSGSAWIHIHFGQLDPDPDPHWEYRDPDPDPGGPKLPTKVKKIQVLCVRCVRCVSLDVLYGEEA